MKEHRLVAAFALLILSLCVTGIAQSATRATPCDPATPDNAVCLTGTPPTLNTDGTAITVPLTFRVEQKVGASAYATVATGLTALQYYAKNLAPGDYTWRVYVNCVGIPNVVTCTEGPASNAPGKTVAVPTVTPGPAVLIIAATIRKGLPPIYRVVYTVTPRDGELVFVAPVGMRAAFAK